MALDCLLVVCFFFAKIVTASIIYEAGTTHKLRQGALGSGEFQGVSENPGWEISRQGGSWAVCEARDFTFPGAGRMRFD